MFSQSSWLILFTFVSITNFISCAKQLKKFDGTVKMYQDYDNPEADTSVVFKFNAPRNVLNDYPIERFDVTYYQVGDGQSAPKTVSHTIVHDGRYYIVKIKNLEPDTHYIFNANAIYGSKDTAEYFMPTHVKNYEVDTQPLAPKTFLSKDNVLSFESNHAKMFSINVKQQFGDEFGEVMDAEVAPEMNTLLLNFKAGERYLIQVRYEDNEGKMSAISEIIYPM